MGHVPAMTNSIRPSWTSACASSATRRAATSRASSRRMSSSRCACATASTSSATRRCCASRSPTACCSVRQLRKLADIARRYDRGYGHFTTRQNLQLTGRGSRTCRTSWPSLPACRCTPSRRAATACATSPPITWPASPPMRSMTRAPTARSSASGRRCTRSSPTCRASSRSRSPGRRRTARPPRCTTSACTWCAPPTGRSAFRVLVGRWPRAHADHRAGACASSCRGRTCSPTSRRSCASTTATDAATISTRHASRSW